MDDPYCCNLATCHLANGNLMTITREDLDYYKKVYCCSEFSNWLNCRRYQFKKKMNYCPENLLPDSTLTDDEIIDQYE